MTLATKTPAPKPLTDRERAKRELRCVKRVRRFPENTCPASRHVQMVAEALARGKVWPSIKEDPEHIGGSMLSTVASLYEARTEIDRLRAKLGMPSASDEAIAKWERKNKREKVRA